MNVVEISDENLVKGCIKGDGLYQKTLFDKFSPRMLGIATRYTKNSDEAHDILQETFIKVFNNLNKYKSSGSFEGWIRRICVNTSLDYIRRTKNLRLNDDVEDIEYKLTSTHENVLDKMAAEDLLDVLNELPEGYKAVFNLFVIDGYSHKEISEQLEISINTSKSQFSRARQLLKKLIIEKGLI